MKTKINQAIKEVLEQFGENYFIDGQLNKHKVIQDLDAYDKDLLSALIENETIKENFTITINGHIVLQTNKLIELFEADEYWQDSYTKYSKKIGLTAGGKFIDESTDVVLGFPYKDTILKASMSKEDTDKDDLRPDEPFLNEVIAKEEIDVLLDKKILVNAKKYDENGVHEIDLFDENDNLIIKGNNLLALHTIKERYAGKVKLIYIDPPYNTGNDSFKYNDRFNHSTWLTFMKNRIEIAKELLSINGSLWINIDDDEAHYLKVLCDEIFGRDNFISNVIWQKKFSPQNDAKYFSDMHDHILVFAKSKKDFKVNLLPRSEEMNKRYNNPDNDPRGPWTSSDLTVKTYSPEYDYPIKTPSGKIIYPPKSRCWRTSKEKFEQLVRENRVWFGEDGSNVPRLKRFLKDVKQGITPVSVWLHSEVSHNQEARREITSLLEEADFATPKPEKLIQRIIHLGSNENDIVLDFFMGSATTQAVAHKMNRRYIGIEQMDYINTVSIPRLKKVIEGEQGGISKDVGWQGGGSFVYVELMEKNQGFLKAIRDAQTPADLRKVFNFMLEEAEIDFRVDLEKVRDTLHELSLEDQKKTLFKIIDKNQLYYNYSEIDDKNVRDLISDHDYAFNKSFYERGGE
ncbi:site-specific DNA-methyltransferase [Heyndrickxia coagulans]|uniref:Site-specific DNA-methyltransferase n=1 Tax=Heyndrickxia coagulans TaxID=1398 RepID=A0AAW7CI67_HEYCO|nr:site-specific DNA-methyltransferase [Heyndrickxia coagulans]MDL5041864.1 site-specific DNA-methyltransferase [Heyndrickxia coagulans]